MKLADLVSDESLLSSSEMAVFLLHSHIVEGARELLGGLYYKGTNPIHEDSTLMI